MSRRRARRSPIPVTLDRISVTQMAQNPQRRRRARVSQHPVPGPPPVAATERFAARTAGMTASEIRALFAVAIRPEVVSLAGGMPNLAALPLDSLAVEVADLVSREGQVALQYGSAQGVPALREQICDVMALEGIKADPDDVVVTVGSQM